MRQKCISVIFDSELLIFLGKLFVGLFRDFQLKSVLSESDAVRRLWTMVWDLVNQVRIVCLLTTGWRVFALQVKRGPAYSVS